MQRSPVRPVPRSSGPRLGTGHRPVCPLSNLLDSAASAWSAELRLHKMMLCFQKVVVEILNMSTQKRTFQVPDPLPEVIGRIYALQTKRFVAATDWSAISEDSSAEAGFAGDV